MTLHQSNEKHADTGSYGTQNKVGLAEPPVFIFGCVRSGTTLLRSMLNAHPRLVCHNETFFFMLLERFVNNGGSGATQFWNYYRSHKRFKGLGIDDAVADDYFRHIPDPNYKHVLDAVMHSVLMDTNKSRWCEKTPGNERFYQQITEYYPDSPILFLIRDPRAVSLSLKNQQWGNKNLYARTKIWNESARILNEISNSNNVHIVRYEHLVENADGELRKICDFIGEEFDNRMIDDRANAFPEDQAELFKSSDQKNSLTEVYDTSMHKWKDELDELEIRKIEVCCARMMEHFDYKQVTSNSRLRKITMKIALTFNFFLYAFRRKLGLA